MISWKYSLEKINGELDLANKKKKALDKLFDEGKVSQPTYDSFSNEVAQGIADIETKQKVLVGKMNTKIAELEQQMKTLEYLLVNSEIRHVSEEVEEETYERERDVLALGLETTRQELIVIKEAISNISEQDLGQPIQPVIQSEEESLQVETETENQIEISVDTETTTDMEPTLEQTEIEEQPTLEQTESTEPDSDVDIVESTIEDLTEPSYSDVVEPLSPEAEIPEPSTEDSEELQTEDSEEFEVEEAIEEEVLD